MNILLFIVSQCHPNECVYLRKFSSTIDGTEYRNAKLYYECCQ